MKSDSKFFGASKAHKSGFCGRCGKPFNLSDPHKDITDAHWTYNCVLMCEPCCDAVVTEQAAAYSA